MFGRVDYMDISDVANAHHRLTNVVINMPNAFCWQSCLQEHFYGIWPEAGAET